MSNEVIFSGVLVLTALLCYHNSLQCGFVFDDVSAIKDNKDLRPTAPWSKLFWNDFWGTPMHKERSHKSYRPLCVLSFRMNYAFSELQPWSYHLVNNVLHAAVCVLFLRVCGMFLSDISSFLAAMLFAVHPVHTEAITGVVGRAELLSSIFYLLALMSYSKCTGYRSNTAWLPLCITVALVTVAMLCKEQGITVIGVCCVYEVFIAQKMRFDQILSIAVSWLSKKPNLPVWLRKAMVRAVFLVVVSVCLLLARIKVMGAQLPVFTRFDNPASTAPFPTRQLTFNYLLPINLWLLLCPAYLCCDWTMGTIPLVESILDLRNLATLLFYWLAYKLVRFALESNGQRARAVVMSLALMVFPFIPASNLFFPVGFVVAERILYAPSMGFCMLVAVGFELLLSYKRSLGYVLWLFMAALILTHSCKTYIRNYDWESEYTIFKAALRVNQKNAKLYNNVGHALEAEKQFEEALTYFQQAAKVQPDDIGAHINVGRTLNTLKQYEPAEQAYRLALSLLPPVKPGQSYTTRIAPNHLNVFINLGNLISKNESRLLEADALLRTAISMRTDFIQAYINRGDILMKLNRSEEAEEQYLTALRYEDDNPDLYYNLGVIYLERGKKAEAFHQFETALRHNPNHKQALFNSAVLRQEIGDPKLRPEAYKRLHQLIKEEPKNEKIYFNLGMLAMDDKKYVDARSWFDKAIEIKEDFRSALFNTALMLNHDLKQPLAAIPYLEQLLKHYPDHTKGLILMGDININVRKDLDAAEANFEMILKKDPDNVQANHNLCVVYVERGQLLAAEKCLEKTLQLAPQEDYVQQHLNIVRTRINQAQQQQRLKQEQQQQQQETPMPQQQQPPGQQQQPPRQQHQLPTVQEVHTDQQQQQQQQQPQHPQEQIPVQDHQLLQHQEPSHQQQPPLQQQQQHQKQIKQQQQQSLPVQQPQEQHQQKSQHQQPPEQLTKRQQHQQQQQPKPHQQSEQLSHHEQQHQPPVQPEQLPRHGQPHSHRQQQPPLQQQQNHQQPSHPQQ
ncbi:hypothetical protein LSH36_447g03000 [Paralvinella palmiformis]|uniref:dolichyl-phosphate-mannose--protein mannosyltransferase n=1 Tax=Paralvinella palmiformis TaxID=53620 RepID=A0AAD9MXY0_9ANNE|nr:hypothetical protein LSH36_447g03000 [Paralvinella palmiformis]